MFVIAIARDLPEDCLFPAFRAAVDGGITHLEITMNTPGAAELIKESCRLFPSVKIGAGTVLNLLSLQTALDAGASFIVSPHTDPELIRFCSGRDIPVFPGALTPTEILKAWDSGASMVKVFPADSFGGPHYIKRLKGPFPHIKLMACGGVTDENIGLYREFKTDAAALGGSLFRPEWLQKRNFTAIRNYAKLFTG